MNWHKVEPSPPDNDGNEDHLPPLDKTVFVIYLSDGDDKLIMAFGGRSDGGERWLWGVEPLNCIGEGFEAEIVCDDEYRVTHWAEIEWPEIGRTADSGVLER